MKTEMRKQFQSYYASEVQKQISSNIAFNEIKVDLSTATLKTKGGSWIISSWHEIEKKPEMAINGFKKAGIFDIVYSS